MVDRAYRLGHDYRNTGARSRAEDEFLGWVNLDGSGMRNQDGIRPLRFTRLDLPVAAAIVLVTDEESQGSTSNPWEDVVDVLHSRITYWGDAKFDERKNVDDWRGNRALLAAYGPLLDGNRLFVPPMLHFSKRRSGYVRFNGLCALERLELTWFEDKLGRPVRNYRAQLAILDEESVDLEWIHSRVQSTSLGDLGNAPRAWRRFVDGVVDRLVVWAPHIRSLDAQLPQMNTPDAAILRQLSEMTPTQFEAAVVTLLGELDEVRHNINRTRPTVDGGFDFFGTFTLPPPLRYEIDFMGEAKKFARQTAVSPQHVSRLVARLARGQYGVFVTTSYFTNQAQAEVQQDRYPVNLVAGADLVRVMRELRIAKGSEISAIWLRAVEAEMSSLPWRDATGPSWRPYPRLRRTFG